MYYIEIYIPLNCLQFINFIILSVPLLLLQLKKIIKEIQFLYCTFFKKFIIFTHKQCISMCLLFIAKCLNN